MGGFADEGQGFFEGLAEGMINGMPGSVQPRCNRAENECQAEPVEVGVEKTG